MLSGAPDFQPLVGSYLARQEWAQAVPARDGARPVGSAQAVTEVVDVELLRDELPGLASVVAVAGGQTFHLVLGWREVATAPGVLGSRPNAVVGPANDGRSDVLVYDALADGDLVLELLTAASEGREHAGRGRVVQSRLSHSALIYDDRLFMKCYRIIEPGSRPEIETMQRLDAVGFNHMLAPVALWNRGGRDLALVREFIPGAIEGRALALTSLRDLMARAESGEGGTAFENLGLAGGDLGPEMRRLGQTTAAMHLALAEAFGRSSDGRIRVHGDYHLRRVMRSDAGWIVAGFGDDPLLGADAGTASTGDPVMATPIEDLADLCYSLRRVALEVTVLQPPSTRLHSMALAAGWEHHNVREFVRGYRSVPEVGALVALEDDGLETTLTAMTDARAATALPA
ncbi:MAG: hypothetical protein ACRDZP_02375 [Acidimicrobiales bacterium]